MAAAKPLSTKQLAVIDDFFDIELEESDMLEKHNLSRKLYRKWLTDKTFKDHLNRRIDSERRHNEIILTCCVREAVANLMKLTKSKQTETARKACLDIITMQANLSSGTQAAGDKPKQPLESLNIPTETAGKLLAVLAEDKKEK